MSGIPAAPDSISRRTPLFAHFNLPVAWFRPCLCQANAREPDAAAGFGARHSQCRVLSRNPLPLAGGQ